mmetsp:Transcript_32812/g.80797  ORF Transcript_32812/g.80797 Transcript_32812/m.80797 type:complete len:304 (-) Transcript_32812:101-1012(-)
MGSTSTVGSGSAGAPASHSADLESAHGGSGAHGGDRAQLMEKGKELPLKARAGNAGRGLEHHLARVPRYMLTGCWGECIAQQGQPWWAYGTLLVMVEYALFVLLSLNGGFKAPKNVSICGYMELLPDWVAFLYCHVAASGVDSTLWHAAVIVKKEPFMPLAVVQMVLSVLCAFTLTGFSIYPRCLWNRHQTCVLWWVYVTSFAMGIMFLRDFRKPNYTVVPALCWAFGTYLCNHFYYESSLNFYTGEAVSIVSYIMWCSSIQRQHGRKYTLFNVVVYDGIAAVIMLCAYRYYQYHVCKVTGKW